MGGAGDGVDDDRGVLSGDPGQAYAILDRHRERVAVRAARLDEIASRLAAVLVEPGSLPGWLNVYERWRPARPVARLPVRIPLSELGWRRR